MDKQEFMGYISQFRRIIRWYDSCMLLQRTAWMAAIVATIVLLVVRIIPIEGSGFWVLLPIFFWITGVIGFALFHPISPMLAAIRVDDRLDLKERLSSSLDLGVRFGFTISSADGHLPEMISRLHEDALNIARTIDVRQAFPLRWQVKPLLVVGIILALCAVLLVIPNPMDAVLAERRAVREESQHQAEKIENLQKDIEQSQELSDKEKEELLEKLAELAQQLRANKGDRQQALADLSNLEEELNKRLDVNDAARQAALESMTAHLQELAGEDFSQQTDALTNMAAALDELSQQASSANAGERAKLAQNLAQLSARASQSGNVNLAQALSALSEAIRSGDTQGASDAASSAKKALSEARSRHALQNTLQTSLSQLQRSRNALASKGNKPGNGISSGVIGPSQGQNPGAGGGSNANVLPPFSGGAANVQSPRGNKPIEAADILNQNIYVPRMQGEVSNNELEIQGQDSGMGQEEINQSPNPLPGLDNPSLVPYSEVFQSYLNTANEAMDQSYVPEDIKEYVRSYFSQLEP